ncbi:MAG: potassium-transporting ATPase subunit F [Thermoplasmata archaeon]
MDLLPLLQAHLGLLTFTLISIGLIFYLAYSMLHPEKF